MNFFQRKASLLEKDEGIEIYVVPSSTSHFPNVRPEKKLPHWYLLSHGGGGSITAKFWCSLMQSLYMRWCPLSHGVGGSRKIQTMSTNNQVFFA